MGLQPSECERGCTGRESEFLCLRGNTDARGGGVSSLGGWRPFDDEVNEWFWRTRVMLRYSEASGHEHKGP